jgi:phosphoglycolate phosphatase
VRPSAEPRSSESRSAIRIAPEYAPGFRASWQIRHVLFDFDGTLSLVRAGWADVMTEMFVEYLGEERRTLARENILRLNGKPTIHQMRWLAESAASRAEKPELHLEEYLRRLQAVIDRRVAGERESLLVHGARAILEALRARGLTLHLASGTDEVAVRREAELLGIAHYFEGRLHGAPADNRPFSKMAIIESILREHAITGAALLSFGDGHVEIENTKRVGGLAVAVASDEAEPGSGRVDPVKRTLLLAAGADVVIPDYHETSDLLEVLLAP